MSDRVLTKEEIDALMNGVSAEHSESSLEEEPAGVGEYNLSAGKERFAGNKLSVIESVNDRFCKTFTRSLFAFVRKSVEVTARRAASMKYSDFVESKDQPASFNIFQMSPLTASGLLVLEAELIYALLSSSFGGAAETPVNVEGREFTLFEQSFIKKIAGMVFTDIESAWKPFFPLEFNLDRSETNPAFVDAALASEIVIVNTFQIEMEGSSTSLSICIPHSGVEPLNENLGTSLADIITPVEDIKQLGK